MKQEFIKSIGTELKGMCGGNINSELWFCGIEWGNWQLDKEHKHVKNDDDLNECQEDVYLNECQECLFSESIILNIKDQQVNIPCIPKGGLKYNNNVTVNLSDYNFDTRITKIVLSCMNTDWEPEIITPKSKDNREVWSKNNPNLSKYLQDKLYQNVEDGIFNLNLFPIAKRNTETWGPKHTVQTGLDKKSYYVHCKEEGRFKLFRDLVTEKQPKVIVCIGKSYREDFIDAFWGKDISSINEKVTRKIYQEEIIQLKESSLKISIYRKENKPALVVLPFLSNYFLSKDKDLKEIGKYIRDNQKELKLTKPPFCDQN